MPCPHMENGAPCVCAFTPTQFNGGANQKPGGLCYCGHPAYAHTNSPLQAQPASVKNDLQSAWSAIINGGVVKNLETRLWTLHENENIQWVGKISELYYRQCYADLLLSMEEKTEVLIKGTSGIGKSLFLMILLVTIVEKAQADQAVIPSINYLRREDGNVSVYRLLPDGSVQFYDLATHGLPDYLLSDSVDLNVAYGKLLSLEVASDDKDNFKNFEKRLQERSSENRSLEECMPLFSYEELLCIRGAMSVDEAEFHYQVFGGSARNFIQKAQVRCQVLKVVDDTMLWMFGENKKTTHPNWWRAIADKISEKLCQSDRNLDKNTINCLMRHRTDTRENIWATKFMEILAGVIMDEKDLAIHTVLETLIGRCGMGIAFESVGHKKISTCTTLFSLQPLRKPFQRNTNCEMSMHFNYPIQLIATVNDISHLPKNSYGLPIHGYFPLADFIVKTTKVTVIGNFTISDSHEGTIEQLNSILQQLPPLANHRVIMLWVVPRENLKAFKWVKSLESIDQYVMSYEPAVILKRRRS